MRESRYRIKGVSDYFQEKYGTANPIIKIEGEDWEMWPGGWADQEGIPVCIIYGYRCGVNRLPISGKVFYGHIEGCNLGELVHESELEPYDGPAVPFAFPPGVTFERTDPDLWRKNEN